MPLPAVALPLLATAAIAGQARNDLQIGCAAMARP